MIARSLHVDQTYKSRWRYMCSVKEAVGQHAKNSLVCTSIMRGRRLSSAKTMVICLLFALSAAILGGCKARTVTIATATVLEPRIQAAMTTSIRIGPRTSPDLVTEVERYLQRYQPGPTPRLFQTTHIYDRHGVLLAELFESGRRTWINFDQVSEHLINATVATEDASFFVNNGIDPARIAGAALQNLRNGEIASGASTITMQLARNLFLGVEQRFDASLSRKFLEAGLAQELTALYTKPELLTMYLNLLNYSNQAYGPEAAAQLYFGKSASELTLAEATLLAGIPQQPAILDPYTNLPAVKQRQRTVLDLMVRHGYLTPLEADEVFTQAIVLQEKRPAPPILAPHFVQYVVETVDARLGDGYTGRAGLTITTTLDLSMQQLAQQIVTASVADLLPQYDLSNAALVVMRPNSGEVLTMVGSADFNNTAIAGQVNVATSLRQPGSAIKPVLYATAFNDNLVSPATVLWDVPVTYTVGANANGEKQIYRPQNYDNSFHGAVSVRTALANSYNIPSVKLLDEVGVSRMLASARAMGVQSLNKPSEWYGLSLTLGGGDVTLLDLTTAFHTLASAGQYWPAKPILSLRDSQNRTVAFALPTQPAQVIAPEAAFLVTDILSDNTARTPAFGAESQLKLSRPAAAKTGTTNDFRDNWTLGYTRHLVAGVWAGNSDGHPMRNLSGITGAAPIWHKFMEAVIADPALLASLGAPADPAAWEFTPPPGVEQRPDCPPSVFCRPGGDYFTRTWLETAGTAGPLADSVQYAPAAQVYVQQGEQTRSAGFCTQANAAPRLVLQLPNGLGLPSANQAVATITSTVPSDSPSASRLATIAREQQQVLAWSIRYPTAVNLGACDQLQALAPQLLAANANPNDAGLRILVDTTDAGGGVVEIVNMNGLPGSGGALFGGNYVLAGPVIHDANCPGSYVMGRMVNADGAPVAGITVYLRDEWGNYAYTTSKSGASDYGQFDFPIPAAAPHQLYLTIVDGNGNQISPAFAIPHKQGEAGDAPCHHVVIQGG